MSFLAETLVNHCQTRADNSLSDSVKEDDLSKIPVIGLRVAQTLGSVFAAPLSRNLDRCGIRASAGAPAAAVGVSTFDVIPEQSRRNGRVFATRDSSCQHPAFDMVLH